MSKKNNKRVNILHYNERFALKDMVDVSELTLPLSQPDKYELEKELTREHNQAMEDRHDEVRYLIDQDNNTVYQLTEFSLTTLALNIVGVESRQKLLVVEKPKDYDMMYGWETPPEHEIYVDENGETRKRPIKRKGHSRYKSGTSTAPIRQQFGYF